MRGISQFAAAGTTGAIIVIARAYLMLRRFPYS
jgi:hypothetical protein